MCGEVGECLSISIIIIMESNSMGAVRNGKFFGVTVRGHKYFDSPNRDKIMGAIIDAVIDKITNGIKAENKRRQRKNMAVVRGTKLFVAIYKAVINKAAMRHLSRDINRILKEEFKKYDARKLSAAGGRAASAKLATIQASISQLERVQSLLNQDLAELRQTEARLSSYNVKI